MRRASHPSGGRRDDGAHRLLSSSDQGRRGASTRPPAGSEQDPGRTRPAARRPGGGDLRERAGRASLRAAADPAERVVRAAAGRRAGLPLAAGHRARRLGGGRARWPPASPTTWTARSPAGYGLESRVGQLLDPLADRLYIADHAAGAGLARHHPVVAGRRPAGRELFIARAAAGCGARATPPCRCTSSARPRPSACCTPSRCCCSATATARSPRSARPLGWGFAWWGTGLYWVAGVMYAVQTARLVRAAPAPAWRRDR